MAQPEEAKEDENFVIRYFRRIEREPKKKDILVKELEDHYFQERPKLSQRLVKILLVVSYYMVYLIIGA